jgi:hypothetical protein
MNVLPLAPFHDADVPILWNRFALSIVRDARRECVSCCRVTQTNLNSYSLIVVHSVAGLSTTGAGYLLRFLSGRDGLDARNLLSSIVLETMIVACGAI